MIYCQCPYCCWANITNLMGHSDYLLNLCQQYLRHIRNELMQETWSFKEQRTPRVLGSSLLVSVYGQWKKVNFQIVKLKPQLQISRKIIVKPKSKSESPVPTVPMSWPKSPDQDWKSPKPNSLDWSWHNNHMGHPPPQQPNQKLLRDAFKNTKCHI